MTVAEVSRITGLPPHTLRFYEKQFPRLLCVERTEGGHRVYKPGHLQALKEIIILVKVEKLSIREARIRLGEEERLDDSPPPDFSGMAREPGLEKTLDNVLKKLTELCERNEKLDSMVKAYFFEKSNTEKEELLKQISRCRLETSETIKIYETFIAKNLKNESEVSKKN